MVHRRVAVIGHVEHVAIGCVDALPTLGEIVHLGAPRVIAGGGGALAYQQLLRGPGEAHFFTALGDDDGARAVEALLVAKGARLHAGRRAAPQTRDVVLVTPDGRRTIVVVGEPLHPRRDDPLPWDLLATCDAAYFTGQDPDTLRAARAARVLVVTARRAAALAHSGVRADVIVGSASDPREASALGDYAVAPGALVMTEGAAGGRVETAAGTARFPAPRAPEPVVGDYGAGDSFAAALTWYLAAGLDVVAACTRAAHHGAAVLADVDPTAVQRPLDAIG